MATKEIPALPGPNTPKSPRVVEKIAEAKKAINEAVRRIREMSPPRESEKRLD